jgi:opacity protein-like surface antigen
MMNRSILLVGAFLAAPFFSNAQAQDSKAAAEAEKIAWYGTWKGGLAEAQRTGKPIMLVSAVPQCHSVPGVW